MTTLSQFLNTLFNTEEAICLAKDAKGTKVYSLKDKSYFDQFNYYSINPLYLDRDKCATQIYHDKKKGRRADINCSTFRNILIEIDSIPVDSQLDFIDKTGLPFTAATYSGSKSIHFIISLENELDSEEDYRRIVARLYKAFELKYPGVIDPANKNPSRLSRLPFNLREDTGRLQELLVLKNRVVNMDLYEWLFQALGHQLYQSFSPKNKNNTETEEDHTLDRSNSINPGSRVLDGWTLNFLMTGATEGSRNAQLFRAACNFNKAGFLLIEALDKLTCVTTLPLNEAQRTIESAYSRPRI